MSAWQDNSDFPELIRCFMSVYLSTPNWGHVLYVLLLQCNVFQKFLSHVPEFWGRIWEGSGIRELGQRWQRQDWSPWHTHHTTVTRGGATAHQRSPTRHWTGWDWVCPAGKITSVLPTWQPSQLLYINLKNLKKEIITIWTVSHYVTCDIMWNTHKYIGHIWSHEPLGLNYVWFKQCSNSLSPRCCSPTFCLGACICLSAHSLFSRPTVSYCTHHSPCWAVLRIVWHYCKLYNQL